MTYLVEAYLPADARRADVERRARETAHALNREGVPVRYVRSILVPSDETCFHVLEAQSKAAVTELVDRAAIPSVRIMEALA